MPRPTWDQFFLGIARDYASMGTCFRRQVGCVLVDANHFQLSAGTNGPTSKWPHCRFDPGHRCPGADSASGTNLDACLAVHSEINSLIRCPDVTKIHTVYTTASPCIACVKALLSTSATRIVFIDAYPHEESKELFTRHHLFEFDRAGTLVRGWFRTWEQVQDDGTVKVLGSSEWKNGKK